MITAEDLIGATNLMFDDWEVIKNLMIDFAKLHVTAALKTAHSYHQVPIEDVDFTLDAYPLNNIK